MTTIDGDCIDSWTRSSRQMLDSGRSEGANPVSSDEAKRRGADAHPTDQAHAKTGQDMDDEIDLALQCVLQTPCFEALDGARCSFNYTMQLTCSNVVSTVVTARILRSDHPPTSMSSIQRTKDAVQGIGSSNSATRRPNQDTDPVSGLASVYAPQSSQSRKAPRRCQALPTNSKYQAQLPAFRRSLPALPIQSSRLNQELRLERDRFMTKLKQERQQKAALEAWAATKIQACFRGFRARPRAVAYATRQKMNTLASIRFEKVNDRAQRKREHKARREQLSRAAILVQACVRRFLAKVRFARLVARRLEEGYLRAVVKIQGVYRGYRLRSRIDEVVSRLQLRAALQIQCLVRGAQARKRVCIMRFEQKCQEWRRAGLPLEFSLPMRTGQEERKASAVSTLRPLYAHRKSPANLAFKTPKWEHEQFYLRIHKAARKLFANQARFTSRFALLLTTTATKQRTGLRGSRNSARVTQRASSTRASSRFQTAATFVRAGNTFGAIANGSDGSRPGSSLGKLDSAQSLA